MIDDVRTIVELIAADDLVGTDLLAISRAIISALQRRPVRADHSQPHSRVPACRKHKHRDIDQAKTKRAGPERVERQIASRPSGFDFARFCLLEAAMIAPPFSRRCLAETFFKLERRDSASDPSAAGRRTRGRFTFLPARLASISSWTRSLIFIMVSFRVELGRTAPRSTCRPDLVPWVPGYLPCGGSSCLTGITSVGVPESDHHQVTLVGQQSAQIGVLAHDPRRDAGALFLSSACTRAK